MRMPHATQAAGGLPTDEPGRVKAKAVIVAEVKRLRWRIWNGKAKNAQRSIARVRKVTHAFNRERDHRAKGASSRKLWSVLHAADRYFRGQSVWLVNYAERHRTSLVSELRSPKGQRTSWSIGGRTKRNRCDGPGEALISCSRPRSAVRFTTRSSSQGSATDLRRSHIQADVCQAGVIPPISGQSHTLTGKVLTWTRSFERSIPPSSAIHS